MKNYTITVNGNVYNVTVEEGTTAGAAPSCQRSKSSTGTKSSTGSTESSSSGRRSRQRRGTASVPGKSAKSKQQQAPL